MNSGRFRICKYRRIVPPVTVNAGHKTGESIGLNDKIRHGILRGALSPKTITQYFESPPEKRFGNAPRVPPTPAAALAKMKNGQVPVRITDFNSPRYCDMFRTNFFQACKNLYNVL